MKLLTTSIVLALFLLILLEYATPVPMDDKAEDALLELEEDLYSIVKEDAMNTKEKETDKKQNEKKDLRAPCGFAEGSCQRRRRSQGRRRSFWGKKSQISDQNERKRTESVKIEKDEFDTVLEDLNKLVKNLKDSEKKD